MTPQILPSERGDNKRAANRSSFTQDHETQHCVYPVCTDDVRESAVPVEITEARRHTLGSHTRQWIVLDLIR
jgi:hypothetical protein